MQKRFVDILVGMKKPNQTKAYELAGYECRGKSAATEASRILELDHVKAYYDKLSERATERAQKNAADIIAELEKIGFANIKDYLSFSDKGVELLESENLSDGQMAAISQICESYNKEGKRRFLFKLHDKIDALELLGKRYGIFPNRDVKSRDMEPLKPFEVVLND